MTYSRNRTDPTFSHGYADNNGLRMYYEVHGEAFAGRPPLLLIPGGGSTIGTNFSELIPLLAEHRQVIAVEEEGHGRTQPTSRPLTAENSAGDILAVLGDLNVETVDVLGFSAGGHTAIALALARPAAVRRLIAASTFVSRDAVPEEFWDGMATATLEDMPDTYKDADRLLNPEPGHLERLFELDRRRILDFPGWSDDELGTVTAPTLVVCGDRDIVTAAYADRMATLIPGARLLVVPGGHGDYLGEQAASVGDLRTMHATAPFLMLFLDG
jgi:pimeloyl-ACP methyl ester carboxylesterase